MRKTEWTPAKEGFQEKDELLNKPPENSESSAMAGNRGKRHELYKQRNLTNNGR